MRQHFITAGVIALWIVSYFSAPVHAADRLYVNVYIDSEDKGKFVITMTDEGKILFVREDLLRLGIKDIPTDAAGDDGYVSLSPRVRAELDKQTSILHLTIGPALSPPQTVARMKTNVHLNGEEKGDFLITLTDEGKILFAREDLLLLGIKEPPTNATTGQDGYVSLSPQVRAEFDKQASLLNLTVDPPLLDRSANDLSSVSPLVPAPVLASASEPMLPPVLAATPIPEPGHATRRAITNVHLNLEDKGDFFIKLTDTGKIFFTRDDLSRLGLMDISSDVPSEDDNYVPLPPHMRAEFDEKTSILHLTADPEHLGKTTVDLARKAPDSRFVPGGSSAFINYGLSYSADDDREFASLSMPLEAGITTNGYLGISSFSYVRDIDDDRFVRLMTSVVKDNTPSRTRVIVGDFSTSSGILGSGGLFGGLSIATKFSIDPYSLRYPGANLYGAVNTPSDVEIYVNGLLVGKSHLSPGEFEFLNVGNVQGSGEATMVLKDAYGREQTITVPYYTSAQLLRPGLHDYSYSVGYQREAFGQESNEYGDAAFLGYHRIGISDVLTTGLRAEADTDVVNGGVTATFLLGTLGEFDISAAFSRDDSANGNGWSARYSRSNRYMSWGLFGRGFSRDYSNLTITSADDKSRLEASGNIGFRQDWMGSISLFYSKRDMYEDVDRKRYGVNYNRRLAPQVSLNIVAARTVAETTTNELFANLMIYLGKSRSANAAYQKQGNETAGRVTLQQNAPLGTGLGYRLIAERRDNGQDDPTNGGDAYLQYRGNHGIYSAEYWNVDGNTSYTVGTTGGIAFINSSAYFTRPIYDGFVLAKVGTLENVAVKYNNQDVGVTDKNGELLIPSLVSYYQNSISINDKDIPVNYELSETSKSVSVPYRTGGIVQFEATKLQGFTGRLFINERGAKTTAEYWGLQITQGKEVKEVIVGKNGAFYLENLPAGRFPARLFSKDKACSFVLSIPDSEDLMVNMGDVICERN
jgi:outer membrane usher protein